VQWTSRTSEIPKGIFIKAKRKEADIVFTYYHVIKVEMKVWFDDT
jgi:hypothetical protein